MDATTQPDNPREGDRDAHSTADNGSVQTVEISPGRRLSMRLGCRVLLVEDGLDNARLVSRMLEKAGADVTIAENGRVGVDLTMESVRAGQPYDVILMDMNMPVMDGYTATSLLRDRGYIGPIIALTSNADPEDRDKCLAAGCDEYAAKPVTKQALVSIAHSWSEEPRSDADTDTRTVSAFANDPDRRPQIENFVRKLQVITHAMGHSFERGDSSMLSAMARQLKGAAKGYGFSSISKAAAAIEHGLDEGVDQDILGRCVNDLTALCEQAGA